MQETSSQNQLALLEFLSQKRINLFEIEELVKRINADTSLFPFLYEATKSEDVIISWHAWWTCEHLARINKSIFSPLKEELIERLQNTQHKGTIRLIVNILLYSIPVEKPISVPLLNFCLDNMLSLQMPVSVQSSCMKLAHKLCLTEPELLTEFNTLLDNVELEYYTPSIRASIRKTQHKKGEKKRGKIKF